MDLREMNLRVCVLSVQATPTKEPNGNKLIRQLHGKLNPYGQILTVDRRRDTEVYK